MKKQRMLFLGAGRMAEAILSGLVKNAGDRMEQIIVSNRSKAERLTELEKKYGVTGTSQWRDHIRSVDTVLLAMKPGDHEQVLKELAPYVEGQFVLTVAAGVGVQLLEQHLPEGTPVAWVMPNTAAMLGESMSLYCLGRHATDEHRDVLTMLLEGIGSALECTEEQIHSLTAVSGAAPAFLYRVAEILQETAMGFGLEAEEARQLVVQMFAGSAKMMQTGTPPAVLRDQVTTPGGATAAGLRVLEAQGLPAMLQEAVHATNARSREMAGEQKK